MNNSRQITGFAGKIFANMPQALCAVVAAAVIAGGFLIVSGSSGEVAASAAAFSDRFIVNAAGPGCSKQSWPYYEARCLRGADGMHSRPVRMITTDRISLN